MPTSTRKRTNQEPSAFTNNPDTINPSDLPPERPRKKALRRVSPPLSSLSLNKLIYILALCSALLIAFYSYRIVQYKSQMGGWWNLALGKRPQPMRDDTGPACSESKRSLKTGGKWWAGGGERASTSRESDVEDRINALAEALGMPPKELASAIASAVKEYVPPASLSSISLAAAKETGKGSESAKILWGEDELEENGEGVLGQILDRVVGMDEPPSEA